MLQEGYIGVNKQGLDFKVIRKIAPNKWEIEFLEDGARSERESRDIKEGAVRHPTMGKIHEGMEFTCKSGKFKVVAVKSANEVLIRFEDGSESTVTAGNIRKGAVGHPTSGLIIGQKFKTNSGWEGEVIKYNSCYDVLVKWQDGSTDSYPAGAIHSGSIKPPYQPSICGVGYFGKGRFTDGRRKDGEKIPDQILGYWHRMICRCYNPTEVVKDNTRRYIFTSVCKEWFNLQNFAEWAISQPNWDKGFDLEKDLLGETLEYNPQNCTFLPSEINVFLVEKSSGPRGLPVGVNYVKPRTKGSKEGYLARCNVGKTREYLGYFDDPMQAYAAYKVRKEVYARELAEKYKDVITEASYNALMNWTLKSVYNEETFTCANEMQKDEVSKICMQELYQDA